jgi:hypothetical protein
LCLDTRNLKCKDEAARALEEEMVLIPAPFHRACTLLIRRKLQLKKSSVNTAGPGGRIIRSGSR